MLLKNQEPLQKGSRSAEALAHAEGADSTMKGDKQVKISRITGQIVVDLEEMLRGTTESIPLKGGDVIMSQWPCCREWKVEKPGNIPWKKGLL